MFENDYILREIHNLTRILGEVFFQKEFPTEEIIDEAGTLSESGFLRYRLKALLYEKKINEAENLLFETLTQSPTAENLQTALIFYKDLQAMSDGALAECNFSKEEIAAGLRDVRRLYERDDKQ